MLRFALPVRRVIDAWDAWDAWGAWGAWVACAAVCALATPVFADSRWTMVRTPTVTVIGDQSAGRLRDVPIPRIDDVLSDLVYGTMFTNHFSGRHKPLEEQARDILDIVHNGILSESERRRRSPRRRNEA